MLLAFHDDPAIKAKYLARVAAHRAADEIVQGVGYEREGSKARGCAVGCTLDRYDHAAYPDELGIPEVLAHLEDQIHESLPLSEALDWPGRFLAAPEPGADLSGVWPEMAIWLLTDGEWGVLQYTHTDESRAAIQRVADLYRERVPAGDPRWREARAAAAAAADAAYAYAAAYVAAAAAADAAYAADAASAAAYAAAYAADAYAAYVAAYADDADAAAAAADAFWRVCSDKLVALMRAARWSGREKRDQ